MKKYQNRRQAGQLLAEKMALYADTPNAIVLGLPRGGVPIAFEIAIALQLPLDVFIVRKLGCPWHEELALGAIASGGGMYLNLPLIQQLQVSPSALDKVIAEQTKELHRREQLYRGRRDHLELTGKNIILVDDGIATGATMLAAIAAIKSQHPKRIIVAAPVAAADACRQIEQEVDALICPLQPDDFYAVGYWYEVFDQTQDDEVIALSQQGE